MGHRWTHEALEEHRRLGGSSFRAEDGAGGSKRTGGTLGICCLRDGEVRHQHLLDFN